MRVLKPRLRAGCLFFTIFQFPFSDFRSVRRVPHPCACASPKGGLSLRHFLVSIFQFPLGGRPPVDPLERLFVKQMMNKLDSLQQMLYFASHTALVSGDGCAWAFASTI